MKSHLLELSIYLLLLLSIFLILKVEIADADMAKPGCQDSCGNVSIPFPFGIGPNHNCFHNEWFEIECNTSRNSNGSTSTKPFLSKFHDIEVLKVGEILMEVRIPPLNACSADPHQKLNSIDFRRSPFGFLTEHNILVMEGCPGDAVLVDQSNAIRAGCATICNNGSYNNNSMHTNNCNGDRCCNTGLSPDSGPLMKFYQINFSRPSPGEAQYCLAATLVSRVPSLLYGDNYVAETLSLDWHFGAPVTLMWSFGGEVPRDTSPHAFCENDYYDDEGIFNSCYCGSGYYGNPYISNGCQVPRECNDCQGYCHGTWDMDGTLVSPSYHCERKPVLKLASILGLSISFGTVIMVILFYGLYRFVKRILEMKQRAKFFKRNGGLLLQQQLSSNEGTVERTKIFSMSDLDKATDHFNENRILGQGGQGTVYKGMLSDGKIVAIKKSKLLDESQLEQFINEVVILSQINHRNVVKLLGCCLETEVPLLVYEFIPNGTLYKHIHDPDEDFTISWEMCLKIAAESATAVAYLHSSSSIPIFHRDIKSANILLDEKHRAKVSDFGSSRTIAIDQTHMTTIVQGTMGYLDPEYFQSCQFTEKSDVYSFGVVLLELLARKRPIYRDAYAMEQKNLVTEFLYLIENSRLYDILDPTNVREAKENELLAVVELTKRCVSLSGKLRPTMKEVAMILEMIIKSPAQVSRWYQEQEALPIEELGFDEYAMLDTSDAEFMSCTDLSDSY